MGLRGRCPDAGTCHSVGDECALGCYRVACCEPLSGVFPGDVWPEGVKAGNERVAERGDVGCLSGWWANALRGGDADELTSALAGPLPSLWLDGVFEAWGEEVADRLGSEDRDELFAALNGFVSANAPPAAIVHLVLSYFDNVAE